MEHSGVSFADGCRFLAMRAHKDQLYGDQPYHVHLEHTVAVLRRFGIVDEIVLGSGYLHDVVEDTELSLEDMVAHLTIGFGAKRSQAAGLIVDAVTDGEGKNRKERKARPYRLIPERKNSIYVKLGDRIANLEVAHAQGNYGLIKMYYKEQPTFEEHLFNAAHAEKHKIEGFMWDYQRRLVARMTIPAVTGGKR